MLIDGINIISSEDISPKNIKFLFWGGTGSRKTETFLRLFPNCLIIDSEGNSDHCKGKKEIPPFMQVKTKDPRDVKKIIKAVAAGKIKMQNGQPVMSIGIDSVSVFWKIQNEVAQQCADQRALKYHEPIENANATPRDWGVAKRPMQEIQTAINNSGIPFLVMIAREKLLTKTEKGEQIIIGYAIDAMKGTDFEANVGLRFIMTGEQWSAEITKVQGKLGEIFPNKSVIREFPIAAVLEYAKGLKADAPVERPEEDIVTEQQERADTVKAKDQSSLLAYAKEKYKMDSKALGAALKVAGFSAFDKDRYDEMIAAVDAASQP